MARRQGAVLCTHCRQLISSAEQRCPHCGAAAPALFGFGPGIQRFFRDLDLAVVLSFAAGALYFLSLGLDPSGAMDGGLLGIGTPSGRSLYLLGMTGGIAWDHGHYWTALTATFLHGSLVHIFFNLSWVRNLVPTCVEIFGPARTWAAYALSGVGGALLSNLVWNAPTIGASGAIFGLQGALIAFARKRGGTWGQAVSGQVIGWVAGGIAFGFLFPGVNNLAHLGGLLVGFLVGRTFPVQGALHERRGIQLLGILLAVLTAAGFVASALTMPALLAELS